MVPVIVPTWRACTSYRRSSDVAARAAQELEPVVVLHDAETQAQRRLQRMEVDPGGKRVPHGVELVVDARFLAIETELGAVQRTAYRDSLRKLVRVLGTQAECSDLAPTACPSANAAEAGKTNNARTHSSQHRTSPNAKRYRHGSGRGHAGRLNASH